MNQPSSQRAQARENLLPAVLHQWNGQTFGTQLWTTGAWRAVGQDSSATAISRGGKIDPTLLMQRLGDVYNSETEASSIRRRGTAGYHPSTCADRALAAAVAKPHQPNLTSAPGARPTGSTLAQGRRRGYQRLKAWNPGRWAAGRRPPAAAFRVLTERSLSQATSARLTKAG